MVVECVESIHFVHKVFIKEIYPTGISLYWDKDRQCCGLGNRVSFVVYKSVMQQPRLGDGALPVMIMGMRMMVMLGCIEVKEERKA